MLQDKCSVTIALICFICNLQVVEIMKALCEFFPGADTPINYDDCEDDDTECSDDEYMYDTRDSLDTETDNALLSLHVPTEPPAQTTNPAVVFRHSDVPHANQNPRPRSIVETQVNKLQNLIAAEAQPKTAALTREDVEAFNRIGPIRIPQQFKRIDEAGRSAVTINRTSSSPVPPERPIPSEGSTPQDTLRVVRSPIVFSESSSPRRLSPIVNYNIGNMNPRHIDMEQFWNRENDKLSPARSPSVNSNTTNSLRKEDYNQNYCDRLSAGNSPMTPVNEFNGNVHRGLMDPRYQIPLQIEVGPVSIIFVNCY